MISTLDEQTRLILRYLDWDILSTSNIAVLKSNSFKFPFWSQFAAIGRPIHLPIQKLQYFHRSWDWLHILIDEMFLNGFVTIYYGNHCFIQSIDSFKKNEGGGKLYIENYGDVGESQLILVYRTIIEFLIWRQK